MRILWHNVFVLALVIFAISVFASHCSQMEVFMGTMGHIGPGNTADDQVMGLIAFGLVLVAIVAVLKIMVENNGKN